MSGQDTMNAQQNKGKTLTAYDIHGQGVYKPNMHTVKAKDKKGFHLVTRNGGERRPYISQ